MKSLLLRSTLVDMVAAAITAWVVAHALDPAVRWALYRAVYEILFGILGFQLIGLWCAIKRVDFYRECRSCSHMRVMDEDYIANTSMRAGGPVCDECGNTKKVVAEKKLGGFARAMLFLFGWITPSVWGAVEAKILGGRWWVGALTFLIVSLVLAKIVEKSREAFGGPRRRRGVTPEGFELEVEESTGFRTVMVCCGCQGRMINYSDDEHPPDARTPMMKEPATCPHCNETIFQWGKRGEP